jgi:hypothetical protein
MKAMKTLFECLLKHGASVRVKGGTLERTRIHAPQRDQYRRSSSRLVLSLYTNKTSPTVSRGFESYWRWNYRVRVDRDALQ